MSVYIQPLFFMGWSLQSCGIWSLFLKLIFHRKSNHSAREEHGLTVFPASGRWGINSLCCTSALSALPHACIYAVVCVFSYLTVLYILMCLCHSCWQVPSPFCACIFTLQLHLFCLCVHLRIITVPSCIFISSGIALISFLVILLGTKSPFTWKSIKQLKILATNQESPELWSLWATCASPRLGCLWLRVASNETPGWFPVEGIPFSPACPVWRSPRVTVPIPLRKCGCLPRAGAIPGGMNMGSLQRKAAASALLPTDCLVSSLL